MSLLPEKSEIDPIEHFKQAQEISARLRASLPGLFNRYYELLSSDNASDVGERLVVEDHIGKICNLFGNMHGIGAVAADLYNQGIINSRADVLELVSPIIREEDSNRKENPQSIALIGVVGRISSGKGSVGEIIANNFGGFHLPLSDRLREIAAAEGKQSPFSRDSLRTINDVYKPRFGKEVFVRWTIRTALNLATRYNKHVMSMDGFRSLEEAQYFKSQGGYLIAIEADDEVRFQRLLDRKRSGDDFTKDIFNISERKERPWIDPIFQIADVVIDNNGTYEELENATLLAINQFTKTE